MYIEQTPEGYNIISIPSELMPAIQTALQTQSNPHLADDLPKEQKRSLRNLAKLIIQECEIQG